MKIDPRYFAGLFDGEGSITINASSLRRTRSRQVGQVRTSISLREGWLLRKGQKHWGGSFSSSCRHPAKHARSFRWVTSGKCMIGFLTDILPHLQLKAPQARIALRFQAIRSDHSGFRAISDLRFKRLVELNRQLKLLNRKGPNHGKRT